MDNRHGKRPMEESTEGNFLMRKKIPDPNFRCPRKADPRDCSGCVTNFSGGHKRVPEPPVAYAGGGGGKVPQIFIRNANNMNLVIQDSSNRNYDVVAPVKASRWSERCTICGMIFLSLKSLFNHYNECHPEREARGSSSGNGSYKAKKMIALWPGNWSRTAKRSDRNVKQAAITLMNIYNLEMQNRKLKMFNFKNPLLNYPSIHKSEAIRNGKAPAFSEIRNPPKRYSFWSDQGFVNFLCKSPKIGRGGSKDRSFKGKASSSHLPKQGISRKTKTAGDNSSSYYSPEAQFKCTICYKSFPSYQALGGHRSCHNKPKNLALDMINNSVGRGMELGGGHKRSHWGDAGQYDEKVYQGSYLERSQLKKMKNAHEFEILESAEAEHFYNYNQQEDEEMEDQHEEEEVEDQEEAGTVAGASAGAGASYWDDIYSDGTTTSTPFATSSSS